MWYNLRNCVVLFSYLIDTELYLSSLSLTFVSCYCEINQNTTRPQHELLLVKSPILSKNCSNSLLYFPSRWRIHDNILHIFSLRGCPRLFVLSSFVSSCFSFQLYTFILSLQTNKQIPWLFGKHLQEKLNLGSRWWAKNWPRNSILR